MGLLDSFKHNARRQEDNPRNVVVPKEDDRESAPLEDTFKDEIKEEVSEIKTNSKKEKKQTPDVSRETSQEGIQENNPSVESSYKETPIKSYSEKKPVTSVVGTTKVIAILNQKGGVGKSTTTIDLGAALGEEGKQVLLIDFDPQGNTSSGLGVEKNKLEKCIYDVILGGTALTDVIIPDVCKNLDLSPATINLAGAEVELVPEMARESRLKEAIGAVRGRYDYIFIDCPPSLGLLTVNALVAADKLLIPIQCEFYALEGVTKLLDSMKRVKTYLNPSLEIFGVLLTMYDGRTTLSKQVENEVRTFFTKRVFNVVIPRSVKISEAPSFGQPITQYDPNGKGAEAYRALAKEVISRA